MEDKKGLREKVIQRIRGLSFEDRLTLSKGVIFQLESLGVFQKARSVFVYVSKDWEVSTHEFIRKWISEKEVCVPRVIGDRIVPCRIWSWSDLTRGQFGILEPTNCEVYENRVDLVIVPAVAVDKDGRRLGRGKGYYDRFLQGDLYQTSLAIVFYEQIVEEIPTLDHDQSVGFIVTESAAIEV